MCFEKMEDAEKLNSVRSLDLRGITATVVTKKVFELFCVCPWEDMHETQ